MSSLHEQLGDAVADVTADLDRLTGLSRKRGLTRRRRSGALVTAGVVAVVAAASLGGLALRPGNTQGPVAGATGAVTSPGGPYATDPPTVALTGRSAAALLIDLLSGPPSATVDLDSVRGFGGVALADDRGAVERTAADNEDVYAEAMVGAHDDAERSLVSVSVQRVASARRCPVAATACTIDRRPDGDALVTYVDEADTPGVVRRVAVLTSLRRDLRVTVTTSTPNGETPSVSLGRLSAVAVSPRWELPVPTSLVREKESFGFTSMDYAPGLHPVDP